MELLIFVKSLILANLVLIFCENVLAQEFSFGGCPPFPTVKNFDAQRYAGKWFEYSNYFAFFQLFGKCVTATYTILPAQSGFTPAAASAYSTSFNRRDSGSASNIKIEVVNRAVNQLTGAPQIAKGEAILNDPFDPLKPGELIVNFEQQPSFTRATSTNYNIIDTDYDSFAIVYSCNNYGFLKSEILWVLTRNQFPSKYLIRHIYKKIETLGLDSRRLKKTPQTGCEALNSRPQYNDNNGASGHSNNKYYYVK